ncbi:MAG TPA: 4'-phosphopantetheinyl transferase superfamily protein [Thermoanaerobaculia bacterium]|nr:4'-phosphopantetheinyl transferase superfamily protein [Thermoanaerobaculia bacterium]
MIITDAIREEWFTEGELAVANGFRLRARREEWLRSRTAAKELALQRGIVGDPLSCLVARPRLIIGGVESRWYVSLSHSKGWAAAAIDEQPVGIDIEAIRDLDERAAHLFLSDEETEVMRRCTIDHRALHFWCAKEAAWKQRSSEFATLRQLPLTLMNQREDGLDFDAATTRRLDALIAATT